MPPEHDTPPTKRVALALAEFVFVTALSLTVVALPPTVAVVVRARYYGVWDAAEAALRFHSLSLLLVGLGAAWVLLVPLAAALGRALGARPSAALAVAAGAGAAAWSYATLILHEPFTEYAWMPIPFVGMGCAFAAWVYVAARAEHLGRWAWLGAASALLATVGAAIVDARVLPTTYDTFHAALRVATLVSAQCLAAIAFARLARTPRLAPKLLAAAACLATLAPLPFVAPASRAELGRVDKYTTLDQHTGADAFFITKARDEIAPEACADSTRPPARVPEGSVDPTTYLGEDPFAGLKPTKNIMLITIEALRYDRTSLASEADPPGPLARWASKGILLRRGYSPSPKTLTSISSYLTLKHTSQLRLLIDKSSHWLGQLHPDEVTLADAAKEDGRVTFATVHGRHIGHDILGFDQGFDTFRRARAKTTRQKRSADKKTLRHARSLLRRHANAKQGFFGWTFFVSPHSPYFMRDGKPGLPRHTKDTKEAYDTELAYTEGLVDELLTDMEEAGRLEDTTVIITGDHGEALGDHGMFGHRVLYEHQLRTPFIVLHPDAEPAEFDAPVQTLHALAWTLAGASGELGELARAQLTGDLGVMEVATPGLVLAETISSRQTRAAFVSRDAKLIWKSKHGTTTYYDLATDPGEKASKPNPVDAGISADDGLALDDALRAYQRVHACARAYSFGNIKRGDRFPE